MTSGKPITPQDLPKFAGIKTFMRLPHTRVLDGMDFAVVGIPWDGGTSYRTGQRSAPDAIRKVSVTLRPFNRALNVPIFDHCSGVDYGDVKVIAGYIEDTYKYIEAEVSEIVKAGVIPIALGGDHSITLPELRAVSAKYGPVALVHFDSHTDTNDHYFDRPYYHGSPFRRAVEEGLIIPGQSIQIGMRGSVYAQDAYEESQGMGLDVVPMDEIRRTGIDGVIAQIRKRVGRAQAFITFDIDVVDPAFAPGTGTPEIGGLTSAESVELIRGLAGIDFVGCDVVELLPEYDGGEITAILAANIAYELISMIALRNKK